MKLFEDNRGFLFAFGFDPRLGVKNPNIIAWCDPGTKSWESKSTNQAGHIIVPFVVAPEFVFQSLGGAVVAYQPGRCIELSFVGSPYVFSLNIALAQAA